MDSGTQQTHLLSGKEDTYNGIVVNLSEPMGAETFAKTLSGSLKAWKDQGKKGIWIRLPIKLSNLVDIAIKEGFTYHHAENDYVMLVSWISTIPENASHRVGIGAFVLNKSREVLVVQKTSGVFKGTGVWKLPTGVNNEVFGLELLAREVEEETGIKSKFGEVLAFRPIEEYVNQPFNKEKEIFRFMANIFSKRSQKKENYTGFSTVISKTLTGKESFLYCSIDHAGLLNGKLDHASISLCTSLFRRCYGLT